MVTKSREFARIKRVIDAIGYKPGYRLKVIELDSYREGAVQIMLLMPIMPSVIDGKQIELVFRQEYHLEQLAVLSDAELVDLVRFNVILAWETHEADEWFTFHGKQVRNPHT